MIEIALILGILALIVITVALMYKFRGKSLDAHYGVADKLDALRRGKETMESCCEKGGCSCRK